MKTGKRSIIVRSLDNAAENSFHKNDGKCDRLSAEPCDAIRKGGSFYGKMGRDQTGSCHDRRRDLRLFGCIGGLAVFHFHQARH